MGLFSKTKSATAASSAPMRYEVQKAMMIIGCGMMVLNDDAGAEINRIKSSAARMPLFSNNTAEEDDAVLGKAANQFDENIEDAINWACERLYMSGFHVTAFCFACDIMLADGEISDEEFELLNEYAERLRIKPEDAECVRVTFNTYYQPFEG